MKGRFLKKQLTKTEQDYIRNNYHNTSVRVMAHELELTYHNVAGFMKEEKLKRIDVDRNISIGVRIEKNGFFNYRGMENWIV